MSGIFRKLILVCVFFIGEVHAEDGYELWLRYAPIQDAGRVEVVRQILLEVTVKENSPTNKLIKDELSKAARGLVNDKITFTSTITSNSKLEIGIPGDFSEFNYKKFTCQLGALCKIEFNHVQMWLTIQEKEAKWWRNSCLLYFQQFSGMPFPKQIEQPQGDLEYYEKLSFPYAPGIRPTW